MARVGTGLTLPYTLIYLHELRGITLSTVGSLIAVQGLVGLVAVPVGGALIDRWGPRPVLTGCLLLQAGGNALVVLGGSTLVVLAAMVLLGVGLGPSVPAGAALLSSASGGPEQVQRAFGLHFSALNAALGLGSLIASAVVDVRRPGTFVLLFLGNAAAAVLAALLLPAGGRPVRPPEETGQASYREALADPLLRRVCVVSLVLALAGSTSLDSGFPAFARAEGHALPGAIGLVFVVNVAVIVCLQLAVLRLLAGTRRTTALAATGLLWALSWAVLGLVAVASDTGRLAALLAFGALFGVGEMLMAPTMQPLVNVIATDRLRGRYNALSGMTFSVSLMVAPAVSSALIGHGLGLLWIGGMAGGGVVAAVLAVRLRGALTDAQDGLRQVPSPDALAHGAKIVP